MVKEASCAAGIPIAEWILDAIKDAALRCHVSMRSVWRVVSVDHLMFALTLKFVGTLASEILTAPRRVSRSAWRDPERKENILYAFRAVAIVILNLAL